MEISIFYQSIIAVVGPLLEIDLLVCSSPTVCRSEETTNAMSKKAQQAPTTAGIQDC